MTGDGVDDWTVLMQAALAGDGASYALVLKAIAGPIRAFARRGLERAGSGAGDAEDVVQEVLLAIHLKRHTWDPSAPLKPWVYAIARHKLIDALRRRGRRAEVDVDDFAEVLAAEAEPERASERDVERALASLTGRQREVVTAVSVDGRSIRDTAAALGMNEGAVRVALHRGLSALSARFGRDDGR